MLYMDMCFELQKSVGWTFYKNIKGLGTNLKTQDDINNTHIVSKDHNIHRSLTHNSEFCIINCTISLR